MAQWGSASAHLSRVRRLSVYPWYVRCPLRDVSFLLHAWSAAFETVYFWPDLANTFKEVLRIIKPGGKFLIGLGTDGNNPEEEEWLATVEGMKIYTKEDLIDYLTVAGFNKIDVFKKENTYIMVLIATKY